MKRLALVLALLAAPMLAACDPLAKERGFYPGMTLPAMPSDLVACLKGARVNVPARDLSVSEAESLWKKDRFNSVAQARCGARLVAWYNTLRVKR